MKKILIYLFVFNLFFLLLILFSPLEFCKLEFTIIDFWFTLIFGLYLFFKFNSSKDKKKTVRILSYIFIPLFSLITAYVQFTNTSSDIKTFSIPNSNKVIISRQYTLFMMGDPRNEMSIGYTFFGNLLIWRTGNTYIKFGMGDDFDLIKNYRLPKNLYDRESVFILEKEGYVLDAYNKIVYKVN